MKVKKISISYSNICNSMQSAFTMIELLLVIAIVSSLAGIVVIALKPAERLEQVTDTKILANSNEIEKALKAYITDNGGVYPASMTSLTNGYYDICNPGYSSGCVDLATYLVPNYLGNLPKDSNGATTELSGFKLGFNSSKNEIIVYTADEYHVIWESTIPSDWLSSAYLYRKPVTLTNTSGSTQTDYQVLVSIDTQALISAGKMKADCADLRFANASKVEMSYWLEGGCNTTTTLVWIKVPSITTTPTSFFMYYDSTSAVSSSSIDNTFIPASISHFYGACNDIGNCNYLDSHAESDSIRATFPVSSTSTVTLINDSSGTDYFFRRYRFLFKPAETGSYYFGVDSDDGSEVNLFPGDGYGGGYNTAHPFGAHTLISYWYGGHGSGVCGTSGSVGSVSMTANQGYWMDYLMQEWTGGQVAAMCIRKPSSGTYLNASTTNFAGHFFARKYTSGAEPTSILGTEEAI